MKKFSDKTGKIMGEYIPTENVWEIISGKDKFKMPEYELKMLLFNTQEPLENIFKMLKYNYE